MLRFISHHKLTHPSDVQRKANSSQLVAVTRRCLLPGFTLLELVIVMTIMVTLAAVGVVNYQRIREKAKETLLKDDLKTMRKLLDQYSADKETLADSLDDLVNGSYLREVPVDPITGNNDWQLDMGDDPFSRTTKQGVLDVHSKAQGVDSEGKPFSDY